MLILYSFLYLVHSALQTDVTTWSRGTKKVVAHTRKIKFAILDVSFPPVDFSGTERPPP